MKNLIENVPFIFYVVIAVAFSVILDLIFSKESRKVLIVSSFFEKLVFLCFYIASIIVLDFLIEYGVNAYRSMFYLFLLGFPFFMYRDSIVKKYIDK